MFRRICNPPKFTIRICNPLKPRIYKNMDIYERIANPEEQMSSLINFVCHPNKLRINRVLEFCLPPVAGEIIVNCRGGIYAITGKRVSLHR